MCVLCLDILLNLRSPEIVVPGSIPVAEEKKMENMPEKLASGLRHCGAISSKKILPTKKSREKRWCFE